MTQYYINRKKHVYICGKIPKGNRVQTASLQFFHMFDSCFIAFYDYICMEMCILVTVLLLPYYLYSYCVVLYFVLYTPILALSQSTHFIYDRQRNINCTHMLQIGMKAQNRSGNNKACENYSEQHAVLFCFLTF